MMTEALQNNWLIGVDTSSSSIYNIPVRHAYTVLGAYPLKDTSGRVVHRLLHVRNPWNTDNFDGPWSDGDSKWTEAFKAQVPYNHDTRDGAFFIDVDDFVRAFYQF